MNPSLQELERIERDAWEDLAGAAPPAFAEGIGLTAQPLRSAFLFMASRIPQFQFNWLSGVGLAGGDGREIDDAVRRFRDAGVRKFFIQIPPGPDAEACSNRAGGLGLKEHPLSWAKFWRPTTNPPATNSSLSIREVGPNERGLFGSTAVAGFGMPPSMAVWLDQLTGRPHWHTYITVDGETPAGAGALFVKGEFAWLGIGSTRAEMRKKGSQSALLAWRLAAAARFGAAYAVTETGVPQPRQPAPSYANILKAGFNVAYVRANWSEP